MTTPPLPPEVEFLRLQDELLQVQTDLTLHLHAASDDPRADLEEWMVAVDHLRSRRDALALRWGRAGLAFLMRGGRVSLQAPDSEVPAVTVVPEPAPEPEVVPPADPPPPPAPPAAPADLSRLAQGGLNPAWSRAQQTTPRAQPEPEEPTDRLADLQAVLGDTPDRIRTRSEAAEEVAALNRALSQLGVWSSAPKEAQQALVGHLVARARQLQDDAEHLLEDTADRAILDRVFSVMSAFSKREQPGFVFGLMRSHTPTHGSWGNDARLWGSRLGHAMHSHGHLNPERTLDTLRELHDATEPVDAAVFLDAVTEALDAGVAVDDPRLVRVTAARMDDLKTRARFKRLRKAIRQAEQDSQQDDAEFEAEVAAGHAEPPRGWPLLDMVRGRRAVLIGGDRREEARVRIQAAFELESLDWVSTDHSRHFQSVANRVASGGCDLVILLRRFIGHDVDRIIIPACRAAGVPWVSVERGYGVAQIRASMDRFLTPSGDVAAR